MGGIKISVAEPPLLDRLRSRFYVGQSKEPEPPFRAAPAASFRQANKESLVLVSNIA